MHIPIGAYISMRDFTVENLVWFTEPNKLRLAHILYQTIGAADFFNAQMIGLCESRVDCYQHTNVHRYVVFE